MKASPLAAIVLAAGLGTRMRSKLPKALHRLAGRPLVEHCLALGRAAKADSIFVVARPDAEGLRQGAQGCQVVFQTTGAGTADALLAVPGAILGSHQVLILSVDVPLIRPESLLQMLKQHRSRRPQVTMASTVLQEPGSLGRVLRSSDGSFAQVVEALEASSEQRALTEVNVGVYCFSAGVLPGALSCLPRHGNGERYLTDVLTRVGQVDIFCLGDPTEGLGINDRRDLAMAEAVLRQRVLERLMAAGVTIVDPSTTYVEPQVEVGQDTRIEPMTRLSGDTRIGPDCVLGPMADLRDCQVAADCRIEYSVLVHAKLASGVSVGPFARLRPGTGLGQGVHVGSFVELKNAEIGADSKVPHLSYLGDAVIGRHVNIGAGTITCNFDGLEKHRTEVGDDVFVGSDTMLVAPVRLGSGSRTGAGSVVTKDVPEGSLAVGAPARVIRASKVRSGGAKDRSKTSQTSVMEGGHS